MLFKPGPESFAGATGRRRICPLSPEIHRLLHFERTVRPLNDFLAAAPRAEPVCGQIAAMVSVNDPLRVRVHDGNDDLDAAVR